MSAFEVAFYLSSCADGIRWSSAACVWTCWFSAAGVGRRQTDRQTHDSRGATTTRHTQVSHGDNRDEEKRENTLTPKGTRWTQWSRSKRFHIQLDSLFGKDGFPVDPRSSHWHPICFFADESDLFAGSSSVLRAGACLPAFSLRQNLHVGKAELPRCSQRKNK